jgi:hypothetical protein
LLLFACYAAAQEQGHPAGKPTRIRVSERVLDNVAVKKVLPQIPCSQYPEHQSGVVTIGVLVDFDGKVKTTSLLAGDAILADCAIQAIGQWEFQPYLINGTPVQVESHVTLKFSKKKVEEIPGEH